MLDAQTLVLSYFSSTTNISQARRMRRLLGSGVAMLSAHFPVRRFTPTVTTCASETTRAAVQARFTHPKQVLQSWATVVPSQSSRRRTTKGGRTGPLPRTPPHMPSRRCGAGGTATTATCDPALVLVWLRSYGMACGLVAADGVVADMFRVKELCPAWPECWHSHTLLSTALLIIL